MLVRNVNSGVFESKYSPNYRIIAIYGNNHIAVKALDGKVQVWCRGHIKKIDPVDKVISLVPSAEDYQKFGRKTKLLIHPDNIPDTNISLPSRKQTEMTGGESEISENYQDLCEKLEASNIEMLNSIDCSVERLNEANISLISAPCPATLETTRGESVEKLLSNKPAVQRDKNSVFSFFL